MQSQAACSGKSVPPGYIPSPWLLTGRYWKKEKRRMPACKRGGESGDGECEKGGRMKQLILEIHLMEKLVHVW